MRKFYLFVVAALFAAVSFAQGTLELKKATWGSGASMQIYYEGRILMNEMFPEFTPVKNQAYTVQIKGFKADQYVGEFQFSFVDKSKAANYWLDMSSGLMIAEGLEASQLCNIGGTNLIKEVIEYPSGDSESGEYYLVFCVYNAFEDVEVLNLSYDEITVEPYFGLYVEEHPLVGFDLKVGGTASVGYYLKYSNVTKQSITWSSSDEGIATVSTGGVATGIAPGTVKITGTAVCTVNSACTYNGENYTAGQEVTLSIEKELVVREAPDMIFTWNENGKDIEDLGFESMSDCWQIVKDGLTSNSASVGDIFSVEFEGMATASGSIEFALVDSEGKLLSDYVSGGSVVKGEKFELSADMFVSTASGANPSLAISFIPSKGSAYGKRNNIEANVEKLSIDYTACSDYKPALSVTTTEYNYTIGDEASQLSATASAGCTLNWYNSESVAFASVPTPSTEETGTITYYVSQSTACWESEKVAIIVTVAPEYVAPVPEVEETEISYCLGVFSAQLSATAEEGAVLNWYNSDDEALEMAPIPSADIVGTQIYKVSQTKNGSESEKVTITVTVYENPVVIFAPEETSFVEGSQVLLSATSSSEGTYSWKSGAEPISGAETSSFNLTFQNAGEYEIEVTLTSLMGCSGSASATFVISEPDESIVCSQNEYEMYVGEHVVVDATIKSETISTFHLETSAEDSAKVELIDKTITALAAGEVTVYAVGGANEKSGSELRDKITITIKEFIPGVEISMPKQVTVKVGGDTTLIASVIPSIATYNEVSFIEKDDEIVTVTADGKIIGKAAGTSLVTAYTKEGLQAQTLVYVTSNDEDVVKIRLNNGDDMIYMKVGEQKTIPCQISPVTIKANDLKWSSDDNGAILNISGNGVVTALQEGEVMMRVSYGAITTATINVVVTKSYAPVISYIPSITMQQPGAHATIDLAKYVSDDETAFENLDITFSENENVAVELFETNAKLSLKNTEFAGFTNITIAAKDEDGTTTERTFAIEVLAKENAAPVILTDTIYIPFGKYTNVVIADMASDDFTASSNLIFNIVEEVENILVKQLATSLRISAMDEIEEGFFDILIVSFKDADGLTSEKSIVICGLPEETNNAPVISAIPQQNETDAAKFADIDMAQYVSDDYTSPSAIVWSASASENVSVKFSGQYAEISNLNEHWRGAEVVTFTATDQGGKSSSIDVTFYREVTPSDVEKEFGWYGKPTINIITSRYNGTPSETFTLIGTYYGAECDGEWQIDGVILDDSKALQQTVKFDEVGSYNAKFIVNYEVESEIKSTDVSATLNVYGVTNRNPQICKGNSISLEANSGVDSYSWSTGSSESAITINPDVTTEYVLTMTKGLTIMKDTVSVRVSVPVELPEDSVMCASSTYELSAIGEDFVSYAWSNGESTQSIEISAEVADYTVTTIDDMGCESSATFAVTKVNELPVIELGDDQTLCDKEIATFDAGAGFSYAWTIQKESGMIESDAQSIQLDSSAYVTVKITDDNMCESTDVVNVTFTYPYPEEIGIVTFSNSSKNIIVAWERTVDVNTDFYQVERQLTNYEWETVGEPVAFVNDAIVVDDAANYENRSYNYRLVTTDGCGNKAYSGIYSSAFVIMPEVEKGGQRKVECYPYRFPGMESGATVYLYRVKGDIDESETAITNEEFEAQYEEIASFVVEGTSYTWIDEEGVCQPGDKLRVAFDLGKSISEKALKTVDGEYVTVDSKSESGPFAIAISNIAEVENEDPQAVESLFSADVVVYPTVVKDVINIALAGNETENYQIMIVDANGSIVAESVTGSVEKVLVQIPAASFAQGVYTVKVVANGIVKSAKVVK